MRSLRRQMPSKIRISMIAPWTTNTPLIAKIKDNWKGLPMNEPFDIAKAIAYAAADTTFTGMWFIYFMWLMCCVIYDLWFLKLGVWGLVAGGSWVGLMTDDI